MSASPSPAREPAAALANGNGKCGAERAQILVFLDGQGITEGVSGYGDTAHRQLTNAAGFTIHLMKPVDPPQLRDLLAGLVREKGTDGVSGRDTIAPP